MGVQSTEVSTACSIDHAARRIVGKHLATDETIIKAPLSRYLYVCGLVKYLQVKALRIVGQTQMRSKLQQIEARGKPQMCRENFLLSEWFAAACNQKSTKEEENTNRNTA